MDSCFGDPPDAESRDGAGDKVTEFVCEIRWDKLGKVSEADELRRGQWGCPKGEGEVGVIKPGGRGVRGELGKADASRKSICSILWITSPAPEHRSARSFFERKQRALPFI